MRAALSRRVRLLSIGILAAGAQLLAGCGDSRSNAQAVYMLIDTSCMSEKTISVRVPAPVSFRYSAPWRRPPVMSV